MACSTQTQFRRGTAAANATFTGVEGEVTYATDTHRLITHDGILAGGYTLALFSDIATQARLSLSVSAPLTYNSATGAFAITQSDSTHNGYLSFADWNTFNSKQAALGFTPENVANKSIDGTFAANSDTLYPSQKATKTYIDTGLATKQNSLGFTPENVANKSVDGTFAANSDTLYPSQKATKTYVDTGLATKQSTTAPGADTWVIFNSGGAFGADGQLTFDPSIPILILAGGFFSVGTTDGLVLNTPGGTTQFGVDGTASFQSGNITLGVGGAGVIACTGTIQNDGTVLNDDGSGYMATNAISWDTTGLFTRCHGDVTAGNGLVSVVGYFNDTRTNANITSTALFTPPVDGLYEVSVVQLVTSAGTAGTLSTTVAWTDEVGATTATPASGLTVATAGRDSGTIVISATAGNPISFSSALAGLVGTTTYRVKVAVKRLS